MKVFCIGFHKTGTSSLKVALKLLGYKVAGPNGIHDPHIDKNVYNMTSQMVEKFDAFQDNPWPLLFKEMDEKCPESKFILTIRDPISWIKSNVNHFGEKHTPMRKWIYGVGCPKGNEEIYLNRFNQHNVEVVNYFKDRPNDLLIMNLSEGGGWESLCPFLGKEVPAEPFPHANKATSRNHGNFITRIARIIKRASN